MATVTKIEVVKSGKGPTLRFLAGNRWYYMGLSLKEKVPNKPTKFDRLGAKKVMDVQIGGSEVLEGSSDSGTPAELNLNTLVSLCTTTATKKYFLLNKGVEGQIKYVVYSNETNPSDDLILYAHTQYASPGYTTLTIGQVYTMMIFIFDGSVWNVTGEITGTSEINITT